jgi:hypothetical protein
MLQGGAIELVLSVDDRVFFNQINATGAKAGRLLGASMQSEIDRSMKSISLPNSVQQSLAKSNSQLQLAATAQTGSRNLAPELFAAREAAQAAKVPRIPKNSNDRRQNIIGPPDPTSSDNSQIDKANAPRLKQQQEVTQAIVLAKQQSDELQAAQKALQVAKLRFRKQSLSQDSTERVEIDRSLATEEIRSKYAPKIDKLRADLASYQQKRVAKIAAGQRGGIDYNAAIETTRKSLQIQQETLDLELTSTNERYADQKREIGRTQQRASRINNHNLEQGQNIEQAAKLRFQSDGFAQGSQKQQFVQHQIVVAGIKDRYRDTNFRQQEKLTELQDKQSDKLRRKETGGTDYASAIAHQRELMRLAASTHSYELAGAAAKRQQELKVQSRQLDRDRIHSRNDSNDSVDDSTSALNRNRAQLRIASTSSSSSKLQQEFDLGSQTIKDSSLRNHNTILSKIADSYRLRKAQQESGDVGGTDYDTIIKNLEIELKQADEAAVLQQKILAKKFEQDKILLSRDVADRQTSGKRSRRDSNLDSKTNAAISSLNLSQAGKSDPLERSRVDNEIAVVKLAADKEKELNALQDRLQDIRTDRSRAAQNLKSGIEDKSLADRDYNVEESAVAAQISEAKSRYFVAGQALQKQYIQTVDDAYRSEVLSANKGLKDIQVNGLKASLLDIKDEEVKVAVAFSIDKMELEQNYIDAQVKIQKVLDDLNERKAGLVTANKPVPIQLEELITATETARTNSRTNYESSVQGLETRAVDQSALAKVRTQAKLVARNKGYVSPVIESDEAFAQNRVNAKQYTIAAEYGRKAAISKEDLRYQADKLQVNEYAAQQQAEGSPLNAEQIQSMNDAIDYTNKLNLGNITAQFDDMARSISDANLELRQIGQKETTDFLTGLLEGTKSFDDLWKQMIGNIAEGMSRLIAQHFTDQLFGNSPGSQGGGILGGAFNFLGGLLGGGDKVSGFVDGGLVPDHFGNIDYRQGNHPIAVALRKEGPPSKATLIAATIGERVLSLKETAAYHNRFPKGILNYVDGGVVGSTGNSIVSGSASSGRPINLGGSFDVGVDLKNNGGKPDDQLAELMPKLVSSIRNQLQDETRYGGIIHRYVNGQ